MILYFLQSVFMITLISFQQSSKLEKVKMRRILQEPYPFKTIPFHWPQIGYLWTHIYCIHKYILHRKRQLPDIAFVFKVEFDRRYFISLPHNVSYFPRIHPCFISSEHFKANKKSTQIDGKRQYHQKTQFITEKGK